MDTNEPTRVEVITAERFRTTITAGVPAWLHMPGDTVTTPHGTGTVATVFDFPLYAVRVGGRLLTFTQTELEVAA